MLRVGDVTSNGLATNPGARSPAPAGPTSIGSSRKGVVGLTRLSTSKHFLGRWVHRILKDHCLQFKALTCVTAWEHRAERKKCQQQLQLLGKGAAGEHHAASHRQICQVTEWETQGHTKGKSEAEKIQGQATGFQKKAMFSPKQVLETMAGAKKKKKKKKSCVHTWSMN